MKYLIVTFSDSVWKIPAEFIARNRAEYYIDSDIKKGDVAKEDRVKAINAEIKYALDSPEEIVDWAQCNMDWEDVAELAEKVADIKDKIEYSDEWTNSEMDVEDRD